MKKKGFTLVELLVVIAIIALLMGILMPALARVRQIAYRLYCGTNLSGIGKAMLIYANDYDDELPRAGRPGQSWLSPIPNFAAMNNADTAYGFQPGNPTAGGASITSCFYLLVKFAEVTPKSFLCKGDTGVAEFSPTDVGVGQRDIVTLFDFGTNGQIYCSYAFHNPFPPTGTGTSGTSFPLTSSSDPGMAVAADPNPWQNSTQLKARPASDWNTFDPITGSKEVIQLGNAQTHQDDGQNILFVDGHTEFEKESNVGVDSDNIYTRWTSLNPQNEADRQKGAAVTDPGTTQSQNRKDSVLLTDGRLATGTGR
ncbi:MAG: type II secretion system protein [Planctomycetota bacterium]